MFVTGGYTCILLIPLVGTRYGSYCSFAEFGPAPLLQALFHDRQMSSKVKPLIVHIIPRNQHLFTHKTCLWLKVDCECFMSQPIKAVDAA